MDSSTPPLPPLGCIILAREGLTGLLLPGLSVLACLIATVIASSILLPYFNDPYKLRAYPGPFFAKFTSAWLSWIIGHNRWSETVYHLHRQHGPIVRLGPDNVSIADPSALAAIYGHSSGALKSSFYDAISSIRIRNLFNTRDRAEHSRKRRIEAHMFSPRGIRALEDTARVHFQVLVRQWDTLCAHTDKAIRGSAEGTIGTVHWKVHSGRVWFDCMPWFTFWSFDTISDLAFGHPFGMLEAAKDTAKISKSNIKGMQAISQGNSHSDEAELELEEIPAIEMLAEHLDIIVSLAFLPAWLQPIVGRLPSVRYGYDAAPKLAGLAVAAVANRFASKTKIDRADMLSELLRGRDEDGKPYGPEELSAEAELLIIAGGDTTANSSCATTYHLARNPRIRAKLQAELDAALEGIDSDVAPYDAVKDLPYLDAVINEGLRLHSTIGAGLPRVVPPGGLTVLGQHLKEGTVVSLPLYCLHRNEVVWGENAHEFYPERWLEASADAKKEMMRSFAPFSVGPRACLGRNLALQQMHIVLATIFHRYNLVLESDAPLPLRDGFVRKPKNCVVGVQRRK
ncbi:hypothetical protein IEO21_01162 [Rhodonia placenta]|uniref:Cytochrome P450 n=1 Tax=Rhodonia placenta TaxID=104341 RepID=A0A8H7U5J2_9APHY|nr:hypothetical protein IEO21_01162 [Postia placenta]